jgi:hypothetical protein
MNRVLSVLTVVIVLFLIVASATAADLRGDQIPSRAYQYRKILRAEILHQWGLHLPADAIAIGAGTIHQESAWRPTAQSPYAKGLTQFTDATWKDMIQIEPSIADLGDVWSPQAAIRALAVYHRRLWSSFPTVADEDARWAFVLSGYNGGLGWVRKDQTLTKSQGGNPQLWWATQNGIESHSQRAPWATKENRGYVRNILNRWRLLYARF